MSAANRRLLLLAAPLLLCGLALTVLAVSARGGDPVLMLEQRRTSAVTAADLERAVASAPEPTPRGDGRPARRADCTRLGAGRALWRCRATYRTGRSITYRVRVQPDGAWRGRSADGSAQVYGDL